MTDDHLPESGSVSVTPAEFDWAIINSLLQAQRDTTTSLERYLLYVTHDDFEIPTDQADLCLEQAITSQERALEDLKAAREYLQQHDDESH
ncbi:hypothetical protein [Halorubrum sp. N11]|uniref:hypothetical protein n=1 Tax=Halorubrum sp. N11 TaxID=3402276 RepID=UPI003EBC0F60